MKLVCMLLYARLDVSEMYSKLIEHQDYQHLVLHPTPTLWFTSIVYIYSTDTIQRHFCSNVTLGIINARDPHGVMLLQTVLTLMSDITQDSISQCQRLSWSNITPDSIYQCKKPSLSNIIRIDTLFRSNVTPGKTLIE